MMVLVWAFSDDMLVSNGGEFQYSLFSFIAVIAFLMNAFTFIALRAILLQKFLTTFLEVTLHDRSSHMMKSVKFYATTLTSTVAVVWTLEVVSIQFGGVWRFSGDEASLVVYVAMFLTLFLSGFALLTLTAAPWKKLSKLQHAEEAAWSKHVEAQYTMVQSLLSGDGNPSHNSHEHVQRYADALLMHSHVKSIWSFPIGSAAIKPLMMSAAASLVPAAISIAKKYA